MREKPCTQCNETKPLSEFTRQARGYLGCSAYCRECSKINRTRTAVHVPTVDEKPCVACKVIKPASAFDKFKYHSTGLAASCKECRKARVNAKNATPEGKAARSESKLELKKIAMGGYGIRCVCCGETNIGFLTFDHVNNDGNVHRKEENVTSGEKLHRWVIKNNFPDRLRVMCYNCNCGRATNSGVCPHKEEK